MKVSEIIDFAVKGELAPLNNADILTSNPDREDNYAAILSYLNLGILELHKKFALRIGRLTVSDITDQTVIAFPTDFMALVRVIGNDDDFTPIDIDNDTTADLSILRVDEFNYEVYNTEEFDEEITSILIRYSRAPILLTEIDDDLPVGNQYVEALINYMAYKAHTVQSGNLQDDNNAYYQRFRAACDTLKRDGLVPAASIQNNHLENNGFA